MANTKFKVSLPDWLNKKLEAVQKNGTQVFDGGTLTIDFDVILDEKWIGVGKDRIDDKQLLSKMDKSVFTKFRKRQHKAIDKLSTKAKESIEADDRGDPKGFENLVSAVEQTNKYLKNTLGELRAETRQALATQLSTNGKTVDPRKLVTVGTASVKEIRIKSGIFENEFNIDKDGQEDISPLLKKHQNQWLYFGAAATGTAGRITVDPKKKVTKVSVKIVKNENDDVPQNATIYEGVLRLTKMSAEVHFVGKSNLKQKDLKEMFRTSAAKYGPINNFDILAIHGYPKNLSDYRSQPSQSDKSKQSTQPK